MCGIAGAYKLKPSGTPADPGLQEAIACMAHRGPDDEGTYMSGRAALGHRRLSILDTSAAGHQPFTDNNGRHTIIYNGEVFNYPELRRQLEEAGHSFRSNTDTEVILRLYTLHGPDFLHLLNGFFTLGIHDAQDDTLFIARDRFGVKPLFWCEQDGRLMFASEMRAVKKLGVNRDIDPVSLRMYFTHHYIPAPETIWKGVKKLLPGHSLHVTPDGLQHGRWYDLDKAVEQARNIADPVQHVRNLLEDAVRIRLLSDVPVGTFLSGGLDSSIISALAIRHAPGLHTFSIGYTDRYFDETPHAEAVAGHIGSNHHTFTLSNDDLAGAYEEFLSIIDEPFADSSALPSWLLNKHTRKHVVVALSGDGADEIFGGYRKHQAELRIRQQGVLEKLVVGASPLWKLLPRSRNGRIQDLARQLYKFSRTAGLSPGERYLEMASFEDQDRVMDLLGRPVDENTWQERRDRMIRPLMDHPGLNGLLRADLENVLPNDMLLKVDLASMAGSLEVRTPFLDHRLVAWASGLPPEVKFQRGAGKQLLRQAFGHLLPETILMRRKQGFEVPLRSLFQGPLATFMNEMLKKELLLEAGVDPKAVERLLMTFRSASPGNSQATLHALLVYLSWWRRNMG
jgi:asparagine synthase (glutamine-hydrolysing)